MFTKNNSKLDIRLTALGIIKPCTKPSKAIETTKALNAPYFDLPMIDDFATAANKAKRPVCDGFTGYRVQAVVDAAFESHKTGKRISVETITT